MAVMYVKSSVIFWGLELGADEGYLYSERKAMSKDSSPPPIELAYQLSIESHKLTQERFIQIDNGIQSVMAMAIQIFLIFPIAVGALDLDVAMRAVVWATYAFLLLLGLGIYARFFARGFASIDPYELYGKYEDKPAQEFMRDVIYSARSRFGKNSDAALIKIISLQVRS